MTKASVTRISCPNAACALHDRRGRGNVVLHGYSKTRWVRPRRYRCKECGRTFSSTTGTAYSRLQHSAGKFERVAALSVEGVSKSAIARIERIAWSTVARWIERAAAAAHRFNRSRTQRVVLREIELDEIRSFLVSKKRTTWVFAAIEVWSRFWPATVVEARSYQNTRQLVTAVMHQGHPTGRTLITTDGFKYYAPAVRRTFGPACVLRQVIKRVRKDRIVTVGRKLVIGSEWKLEQALLESEDSNKLNTSFIERLNLTIRRGCSYLARKTPGHARRRRTLAEQLELFRCYCNFMRPHSSLPGKRTPAMQAGLIGRRLRFRDILAFRDERRLFALARSRRQVSDGGAEELRCAA